MFDARDMMVRAALSWALGAAFLQQQILAQVPNVERGLPDFERQVLPILSQHCVDCHGPTDQQSQLRLDSMAAALRGGDSGEPVIVPGSSSRSYLIERVISADAKVRMPPDAPALNENEIAVLRAWIEAGPSWDDARKQLSQLKSNHWSFQPISRPVVPLSEQTHPIDCFVELKLREHGVRALSHRADRGQLIRRLYLVMHGVPPTPQQVAMFVQDDQPNAWERLVDQVLASPRYGERWAMHWLDLIRFGETNGFETNRERPSAFHFRDWVINALNSDMPYDVFIKAQIAGDAYGEPVGTGFLVAGANDIVKGQDALLSLVQRQDELADIVNTVGTAFLGLTTGCARCHNHKFDPVSQVDFYALQAVFAGVEHGESALPLSPAAKAQLNELDDHISLLRNKLAALAGVHKLREPVNARENVEQFESLPARFVRFTIHSTSASEPCIDELQVFSSSENVALASNGTSATSSGNFVHPLHQLAHLNDGLFGNSHSWIGNTQNSGWVQIEFPRTYSIDRIVWGRDREGTYSDRLATAYKIEASIDATTWQIVASSVDRLPSEGTESITAQLGLAHLTTEQAQSAQAWLSELKQLEQRKATLLATSRVYSGTFTQPQPTRRLYRGDPTAPREEITPGTIGSLGDIQLSPNSTEQERRVALASWIASPANPLTMRVIVNRLWQFHFGTGIVDTPSDFGANGTLPSHPELIDWLASEFVDNGRSIKELHRLILTSQTWQQSSAPRDDALAIDAASRLLWRFPPRRLEAEAIRDSLLAVAGNLDSRMNGPGFSAFEVELENVRHYFPKRTYGPADWRRMIYMTKVRQEKDSTFGVFDCPDASQVTPKRSRSTTPLQALNLLNGGFVLQQAALFADRLLQECPDNENRIRLAYELCFNRQPDSEEISAAITFVEEFGWLQLTRALLNSNEFVFVP